MMDGRVCFFKLNISVPNKKKSAQKLKDNPRTFLEIKLSTRWPIYLKYGNEAVNNENMKHFSAY